MGFAAAEITFSRTRFRSGLPLASAKLVREDGGSALPRAETAREYLQWFDEMGMVHRQDGRPVRYARNDGYVQWRRIDRIREEYTEQEIVAALGETLDQIDAYRAQFDVDHPDQVSLVDATHEQTRSTEAVWEALSEWETLEQRAALFDAARRPDLIPGRTSDPVDACGHGVAPNSRSDRYGPPRPDRRTSRPQ
jgi:hypothetical protein